MPTTTSSATATLATAEDGNEAPVNARNGLDGIGDPDPLPVFAARWPGPCGSCHGRSSRDSTVGRRGRRVISARVGDDYHFELPSFAGCSFTWGDYPCMVAGLVSFLRCRCCCLLGRADRYSEDMACGLTIRAPLMMPTADSRSRPLPRHVAVIGAAGGLGQGILGVCRTAGTSFTAIVRSRPERITDVPGGSRVAVVQSPGDRPALMEAFAGADAVLTALGVTATTHEHSALLSANRAAVEESMLAAGVDRIVMINTLVASLPGQPASRIMRFFMCMPGTMGRGASEQQAVIDALGNRAFSLLRWTLVRGGLNSRGKDERPVASVNWNGALNSWSPVSHEAMGRWMLEEAAANEFIHAAPHPCRPK